MRPRIGSLALWAGLTLLAMLPFSSRGAEPRIHAGHPRLFFRSEPWGKRGLTLDMVAQRAREPGASQILEQLQTSPPNLALRSLLLGDESAAAQVIDRLQQPILWKELTTDEGFDVAWRAMAYDWLHLHPRFTEEMKRRAAGNIADAAQKLVAELDHGGPHIFHTRMYGWAMGVTLAGLALYGDHPRAQDLARYGAAYFKTKLFPARELQDGTVHNGFGYGRKYTMWATAHFISCWLSATGEDLWSEIAEREGDWARREMLFLYYGRYPDRTYLRFGDSYSITSDNYTFRAVAERTWGYGDAIGAGILKKLIAENEGKVVETPSAYVYLLFYDPHAIAASLDSLPTKALFSRSGTGIAVWKSGWGPDDTTVLFKCGNYFDDHGHFDQGHLDVFRRSMLLLDSGAYLTFDGPFRTEYWHRTVAHNTVLIVDPAVPGDEGGQRVFHSQTDASLEDYRRNRQSETGDIVDYQDAPGLSSVTGDLTAAYPADRVEKVIRTVKFVDDRYLVVLDEIVTRRPGLRPIVLWHTPVVPCMDPAGRRFVASRNGTRAEITTLLPAGARLEWVDGFVAGGRKIEPAGRLRPELDMGAGMVEVSAPDTAKRNYTFLHVIDVADDSADPAQLSASADSKQIRVIIGNRRLIFRR
jgi:hypothetical protein